MMHFTINGEAREADVDIRTSLLDLLREHMGLTGAKKGCDHGQCGACTILVNGRRINACLTLAVMHQGDEITTIEGLGEPGALHPLQAAFVSRDAFQCGFCTPGQVCSAAGMLGEAKDGWASHVSDDLVGATALTDAEIAERMSGNICRCAAYPNIVDAIRDVVESEVLRTFDYAKPVTPGGAVKLAQEPSARFIAGGTNLLDLMKLDIEHPEHLVDISGLPLDRISETPVSGLSIGAMVTNSDLAAHAAVRRRYPVLARAILAGASAQIRNKASVGGNLLQRTRCFWFYDGASPCNKREPGSGCSAIGGFTRNNAILGASEHCIATHPSDMAVALLALDARLTVLGVDGATRDIALADLYRLPGDTPNIETQLAPGELILDVELPAPPPGAPQIYRKVRDRTSYAFALVSIACVIAMDKGRIAHAALAFGGLAAKPWRDPSVEKALIGQRPATDVFEAAADILLASAKGQGANDFKIPLTRRTLIATLRDATGDAA